MTNSRGPALLTLTTPGRPVRQAVISWRLWRPDRHEGAEALEDLPQVNGSHLGRVFVDTAEPGTPGRFLPPLYLPPAVVELVGDRCVVAYVPGFRGASAETGAVLEPLTLARWRSLGLREVESLAELLDLLDPEPWPDDPRIGDRPETG